MLATVPVFFVLLSLFSPSKTQLFPTTNPNGDIFGTGSLFNSPSANPATVADTTETGGSSNSVLGPGLVNPAPDTSNTLTQGIPGDNTLPTNSITGLFGATNTADGGIFGTNSITNSIPDFTGSGTIQTPPASGVTQETPTTALTSNTLSATSLATNASPLGGADGATLTQTGSAATDPFPTNPTPTSNGLANPSPSRSSMTNAANTGSTLTNTGTPGSDITSSVPMGSTLGNPTLTGNTVTTTSQNGSPSPTGSTVSTSQNGGPALTGSTLTQNGNPSTVTTTTQNGNPITTGSTATTPAENGSPLPISVPTTLTGSVQASTNGIASPNVGVATVPGTVFPNTGPQVSLPPSSNVAATSLAPSRTGQLGSQLYAMTAANNRMQAGFSPMNINPFAMNSFYSPRNAMFGGNSMLGLAGMGLLGDQFLEMMPFMAMSGGMGGGGFRGFGGQGMGGMGNFGNMLLMSTLLN